MNADNKDASNVSPQIVAEKSPTSQRRSLVSRMESIIEAANTQQNTHETRLGHDLEILLRDISEHIDPEGVNHDQRHPIDLLSQLRPEDKSWLIVAFIRLFASDSTSWIQNESEWRRCVAKSMDEDEHALVKGSKNRQSFEIINFAVTRLKDAESALANAVLGVSTMESIRSAQHKVLKAIRSDVGRQAISVFLAPGASNSIEDVLRQCIRYVDSQGSPVQLIEALHQLHVASTDAVQQLNSLPTKYARELVEFVQRAETVIRTSHNKNPSVQSSIVSIRPAAKRYPLSEANLDVAFRIVVENEGPGIASNVELSAVSSSSCVVLNPRHFLGDMRPGDSREVEIPCRTMTRTTDYELVQFDLEWRSWSGESYSNRRASETLQFEPQQAADWESLQRSDPFSLEPVRTIGNLIGRTGLLNQLIAMISGDLMGSAYLWGQKRIGKTSIAHTLTSEVQRLGIKAIYIEAGDYVHPTASETVNNLGNIVVKRLRRVAPEVSAVPPPVFNGALAPLVDYFEDIQQLDADIRCALIIDEFDELRPQLYDSSAEASSLFLSLRALSHKSNLSVLLVGGERLPGVLAQQGAKLNKFSAFRIDAFSRESDWSDYCDLVTRPVRNSLDFSNESIEHIYNETSGNPYFTKLVCRAIFQNALERRDCHITSAEVRACIIKVVRTIEANTFQHFWTDGIVSSDFERQTDSRKRVIVASAELIARRMLVSSKSIANEKIAKSVPDVSAEIQSFQSRRVLTDSEPIVFCVPLFFRWLIERGRYDLRSTLDDSAIVTDSEVALRVSSGEIVQLVQGWGQYRGSTISEDRVRAWLDQFDGPQDRRLMFELLRNLRFVRSSALRSQFKDTQSIVREFVGRQTAPDWKREVIVSYIDGPGKSGATCARFFADAVKLTNHSIVEQSQLRASLETEEIRAIVFTDDFVGTGKSACTNLEKIEQAIGDIVLKNDIRVVFLVAYAHERGIHAIEEFAKTSSLGITLRVIEMLSASSEIFSEKSEAFADSASRARARAIAIEKGSLLEKHIPLGFGELQLALVFEQGCPNNTLPILWSSSEKDRWLALFPRH